MFKVLSVAAAIVALSGCADFDGGQMLKRTLGNTAASACRSASNCSTNRPDPATPPRAWEMGTGTRPKHDPMPLRVPSP